MGDIIRIFFYTQHVKDTKLFVDVCLSPHFSSSVFSEGYQQSGLMSFRDGYRCFGSTIAKPTEAFRNVLY